MVDTSKEKSTRSALGLFIFLAIILLVLPTVGFTLAKFRRARKCKADAESHNNMYEYHSNPVPLAQLPKPPPVAQPNGLQRDVRGPKNLPRIYQNEAGMFERATLNKHGYYEAPISFVQNEMPQLSAARRQQKVREEREQVSHVPPPPIELRENRYIKEEGRRLTPENPPVAASLAESKELAPFILQPAPKKTLKRELATPETKVQTVANGKVGVCKSPRVCSEMVSLDDARFNDIDLDHPKTPA